VLEWLAARRADAVGAGGEAAPAAPIALLGWSYGALVAQMVAADPVVAERGLLDGGRVLPRPSPGHPSSSCDGYAV
jgi:pimeloyl-ACP methyl ester carboxylesterase